MRSDAEVHRAMAVVGLALSSPMDRHGFWNFRDGGGEADRQQAWIALCVLGWVIGTDETPFRDMLVILEYRLREFGFPLPEPRKEEQTTNGNN